MHRGLRKVIGDLVFAVQQARDNVLGDERVQDCLFELELLLHVL